MKERSHVSRPIRGKRPAKARRGALDNRGAIYVEFLGAFLPIFFSFLCLLQSAGLYAAKLVTRHSAYLGSRAAAVVIPDDPKQYSGAGVGQATGKRKDAVERAVRMGLGANRSLMGAIALTKLSSGGGQVKTSFGRDETVTVQVIVPYRCRVAFAKLFVCPLGGFTPIEASSSNVIHGADYEYP
jgi:hypothetical protein